MFSCKVRGFCWIPAEAGIHSCYPHLLSNYLCVEISQILDYIKNKWDNYDKQIQKMLIRACGWGCIRGFCWTSFLGRNQRKIGEG